MDATTDRGNVQDGSRPGDGTGPGNRVTGATVPQPGDAGPAAADHHEQERQEQKDVYLAPDNNRDHAVGGDEGTTDGQ